MGQYIKRWWKSFSHVRLFATHGLYSPWNSPVQNTGVGSLSLLQGIFPTQGLNPGLLHCRWILYQLSHKGSPRILEWVAYLFSNGSSWPRSWIRVSCIAGGFFINWAISESEVAQPCRLFATLWTVTYQAALSMGFSRQEYWSGLSFPSPEDLPNPGIEPGSPAL